MFALYLTSLALSAGIFGVFVRQILQAEGYVPGLTSGVAAAAAAALMYVAIQFAFMTVVQLLKPTGSAGPLFCEILSHACALVLLPFVLRLQVPWPHEVLARAEPLLYLGVFGAGHVFFKLMTFFAAIRGNPASRLRFALWSFVAVMAFGLALIAGVHWVDEVQQLRPRIDAASTVRDVHGVYCRATEVTEGAVLASNISAGDGSVVTFRIAAPKRDPESPGGIVYLDAYLHGRQSKRYSTSLRLSELQKGWVSVRIPGEFVPSDLHRCEVFWSSRKESTMRKLIGLRPIQTSNAALWISGPYAHDARAETDHPSFVVVSVEGLGSAHMSTFGYDRKTTPAMDRLVARSVAFSNAYTPYPSGFAATWSALTGMGPLVHKRLSSTPPDDVPDLDTLAELLQREGYTTAAFTEQEGDDDGFAFGDGIEQSFEYVDAHYVADDGPDGAPGGSKPTLDRARTWVEKNADVAFLVFVRLHELTDLTVRDRYGKGLTENLAKAPTSTDVYDSTLAYLDGHLGRFLQYIRDQETRKFTCVVLTSPYAIDFNAGADNPSVGLTENALRVPLIIQSPMLDPEKRTTFVSLTDLMPTALDLVGIAAPGPLEGHSVLAQDYAFEPVSMLGDPLVMSLRSERYQFLWRSGLSATTFKPLGPDEVIALFQITRRGTSYATRDVTSRNPKLVAEFREKLMTYAGIIPPSESAP